MKHHPLPQQNIRYENAVILAVSTSKHRCLWIAPGGGTTASRVKALYWAEWINRRMPTQEEAE